MRDRLNDMFKDRSGFGRFLLMGAYKMAASYRPYNDTHIKTTRDAYTTVLAHIQYKICTQTACIWYARF